MANSGRMSDGSEIRLDYHEEMNIKMRNYILASRVTAYWI